MAEQRYRFGGPIPESVQRLKKRRAKGEEVLSDKKPSTGLLDCASSNSALTELRAIRASVEQQERIALAAFIGQKYL